jgi:hypothetical protein
MCCRVMSLHLCGYEKHHYDENFNFRLHRYLLLFLVERAAVGAQGQGSAGFVDRIWLASPIRRTVCLVACPIRWFDLHDRGCRGRHDSRCEIWSESVAGTRRWCLYGLTGCRRWQHLLPKRKAVRPSCLRADVHPEFSPATSSMHGNWHRWRFPEGDYLSAPKMPCTPLASEIPLALRDGGPSDNYFPIAYRLRSVRMYHRPSTRAGDANVVSPILFT